LNRERARGYDLRVAIDEPRHYDSAGCVDFMRIPRGGQIFNPPRGANVFNPPVTDQQRPVRNYG